jgi:hypothetical protein
MNDVYVYNRNLQLTGIIDSYKSLIWVNRYRAVGDCELYVDATTENLNLLKKGYYLKRPDDDMICQIRYIELDTDAEEGNYLIVKGFDVKSWLDQRVVWSTMNVDGNAETFIRTMVNNALGSAGLSARRILDDNGNRIFYLGNVAGFTEALTEQVSYKNIGEKVREYCLKFGWGYRVTFAQGLFYFQLYKGKDKTQSVIFSDAYENLATTTYIEDETNMGNVALVAGEGQGTARSRNVSGYAESVDRFEIYVDAKDISKTITWGDLTALYPTTDKGGQGYISTENGYPVYKMNYINIQIVDPDQLRTLKQAFPDGTELTIDGNDYYQIYNEVIADLTSSTPQDEDNIVLRDVVYSVYLLTRGYEKLSEYGAVTSFEGTIEPNTTFIYKQDYFLGDTVTVQNQFGISVGAQIVEVIEVNDDNGYSVEPKFEYVSQEG